MKILKIKRSEFLATGRFLGILLIFAIPIESAAQQSSVWDKLKPHHLQKKAEQMSEQLKGEKVQTTGRQFTPVPSGIRLGSLDQRYTVFNYDQSWNRNPNPNPEQNFALFQQGRPAGNINGDSSSSGNPIDDFIVVNSGRDETTSDLEDQTYKTAVFFGGNTSGAPDQIIRRRLIPIGDINGDGYSDAVAGVEHLQYPSSTDDAPYVYKGTASGYQKTNVILDHKYSYLGRDREYPAIAFNDFNNDGYDDILTYDIFGDAIYITWGASNLSDITPVTYAGILTSGDKRLAVEDVDQDSLKEVVELSGYSGIDGQIKVLEIDTTAKELPLQGISVEQSFSYSSFYVQARQNGLELIDINGDGYSEIYISERWYIYSSIDNHRYVVEYDSVSGQYNTTPTEFYKGALVPAGDLNNDGNHDFIVGDESNPDKAHIAYGSDDLSTPLTQDVNLSGINGSQWFWNMSYNPYSSFGDLDGDGVDDALLEHFEESSGSRIAARRMVTGIENISEAHNSVFHQYDYNNFFSRIYETEELGDINGDGIDDFAMLFYTLQKVEIYYGGSTISQTPDKTINLDYGPFNMTTGDFTGDGKPDIVVMGFDFFDSSSEVFLELFEGGASMDAVADFSVKSSDFQTADYPYLFGIENIGDVNDDGTNDFLAGSSFAHDSTSGDSLRFLNEAYIFYGGSSISSTPDVKISIDGSDNDYIWAGESAASLGDMNGDGIDDFAVSASTFQNPDESYGQVHIYYGGAGKSFSDPDLLLTPDRWVYGFGWQIDSGDFTGDGDNDIVIGATSFYGGEIEEPPAIHFYEGGTDFDDIADRFLALPDFVISDFIDDDGYLNNNNGTFEVLSDFNNDNKDELILSSSFNTHAALYTFNNNKPRPTSVLKAPNRATGLGGTYNLASGDFDNDGQIDVVLTQPGDDNDALGSSRVYRYGLPSPIQITSVEDVPDDQGDWVRVNAGGFLLDAVSEDIYAFDSLAVRMMTEDSSWTSAKIKLYEEDSRFVDVHLPKTQPTGVDSVDYSYSLKIVALDFADNETRVISESRVVSAKAFDNLAPLQVQGVSVGEQDGLPVISWNTVDDVDEIQYLVYNTDAMSDGPVGSTTSTSFTLPDNYEGIQNFIVRARDVNNNLGPPSEPVSTVYPQTVDYDMTEGWNLIGLPVEADAEAIQSVLSEVSRMYEYEGSYKLVENLQSGKGYWAKFSAADLYEITGLPTDQVTLDLEKGWNLISGVGSELPLSAVEDPGEIIIPGTLTSFGQMYATEDSLKPGTGYWIRASAAGQVTLKHPAFLEVQEQAKVNPDKKAKGIDEIFNAVTITDDRGHSKQLYFGADLPDRFDKLSYTLPPLPPGEVFDARFKQNRRLTVSDQMQISLKKLEGSSLSMKIDVQSLAEYGAFTLKEFGEGQLLSEYTIEPGNTVQLAHSETDAIYLAPVGSSLAGSETPEKFNLEQNYPNPFNPTTRIEYSVAETTPVTLEVFNILGKRVATLVDKEQQPGFYDVTFDGSGLASGLYLYRLKAGSYISIKKFILAK